MKQKATEALSATDPNSHSNPEECLVTHISLIWDVDFGRKVLSGCAELLVEKQTDAADKLVLDSKELSISSIADKDGGEALHYSLGENFESFGSRLEIKLPPDTGKKCTVVISYETSPGASALQWLSKNQTAGKRHPYLFSQCQAIHCRSIVPCQDTPSVKCPYSARVSCVKPITVLMSGVSQGISEHPVDSNQMVHSFEQKVPIPSYLIAIVAGDIVSREIGPRSKVWSEEEYVDKAAYEFAETEPMMKHAEKLMGPYVWGRYDLLVLPPSFPYGGMENPCLTFVTPTLLAGDRSLADVISHELAHSWTGNLVTNKTGSDFWLNEGHTMFVERKIIATLRGGEPFRHFSAIQGWDALKYGIDVLGHEHPYTKLVPNMVGIDPDDAFSTVPYEKGHTLLFYLETLVGGVEAMEGYLTAYIDKYKYKSLNSQEWKDFICQYFAGQGKAGVFDQVDWEAWFSGVGMPPVKPDYDTQLGVKCEALAQKWIEADENMSQFTASDCSDLTSPQVMEFLAVLLSHKDPLPVGKIKHMEQTYKLNDVKNSEIRFKWLRLCIKSRWEEVIPRAIEFIKEQGRMKFVRPIYKDLYDWDKSRSAAIQNFQKEREFMHTTAVNLIAKALEIKPTQEESEAVLE